MNELIILAGMAATEESSLDKAISKEIKKGTELRFFSVSKKKAVYKDENIYNFLTHLVETVIDNTPKRIRLIYVPYKNHTSLVDYFFPFADIQSIFPNEFLHSFYSKHYSYKQCLQKIIKCIRKGLTLNKMPSKNHISLLPIKNFATEKDSFSSLLKKCYVETVITEEYLINNVKENAEKSCYKDARDLIFPASKNPEAKLIYKPGKMTVEYFLASMYRLGRLWDSGFHHDVTHATKNTLNGISFTCALTGHVDGKNATHANIYLNDFVRIEYE